MRSSTLEDIGNDSVPGQDKLQYYYIYLQNPVTERNPMNKVKPDQTPERPRTEEAWMINADEITPTTI